MHTYTYIRTYLFIYLPTYIGITLLMQNDKRICGLTKVILALLLFVCDHLGQHKRRDSDYVFIVFASLQIPTI